MRRSMRTIHRETVGSSDNTNLMKLSDDSELGSALIDSSGSIREA